MSDDTEVYYVVEIRDNRNSPWKQSSRWRNKGDAVSAAMCLTEEGRRQDSRVVEISPKMILKLYGNV